MENGGGYNEIPENAPERKQIILCLKCQWLEF